MNHPNIRCLAIAMLAYATFFPAQGMAATPCAALARLSLPETIAITSQEVPSGTYTEAQLLGFTKPPSWLQGVKETFELPDFCRVSLIVAPQIHIEVWLPKAGWNERYRGEGGGYYVGSIHYSALAKALRAGYATASTDTGHTYTAEEMSDSARFMARVGAFGLNPDGSLNRQLIEDFAYRSQHEMALKAKSIIKAYYAKAPRYSYWDGCSSGGREGLMAVQRFPEDYDGVLAGCPAINWDRFMQGGLWPQTVMRQEVGHPIEAAKLDAVTKAAIAACDGEDGVTDGIINDPRKCHFNPSALLCGENKDSKTCLTPQEVIAVRKIWEGPTSSRTGERLWFGLERGASFEVIAGPDPGDNPHGAAHFQWITQDAHFDWRTLTEADYERDLKISYEKFNDIIGTDQADLSGFRKKGGKVLIFHGESDQIISPRGTLNYFERVLAKNGGATEVNKFARLFMIPGMGHGCSGDDKEPFPVDFSGELVNWVEKGVAPDRIIATQKLPDGATRTRPLCAYPNTAKWSGKGSSDDAPNFICVDGQHDKKDFSVANLGGG